MVWSELQILPAADRHIDAYTTLPANVIDGWIAIWHLIMGYTEPYSKDYFDIVA